MSPVARPAVSLAAPLEVPDLVSRRTFGAATHPRLRDHRIAGRPVLPVVDVVAWLVAEARVRLGGRVSLSGLRILRGVCLGAFDEGGDTLVLHGRPLGDGRLLLELRGEGGLHYRATAARDEAPATEPGVEPWPLRRYPHPVARVYDELLFHGPRFQVLRSVAGPSDAGMVAELDGVHAAGWLDPSPDVDGAALDGGLQLAALWTRHLTGRAALPTGIDHARFPAVPPLGPVRCVLGARGGDAWSTRTDLWFTDRADRVFAELRGVRFHTLPGATYP